MNCCYCGRQLPDDSEFCQYCGKKVEMPSPIVEGTAGQVIYVEKKGWKVATIVLSFLLLFVIIAVFSYGYYMLNVSALNESDYASLQEAYDSLEDDYELAETRYEAASGEAYSWEEKYYKASEKANFLDMYIVIVGTDEKYYHRYGCSHLDDSEFWAFNVDAAEDEGYIACPYCID